MRPESRSLSELALSWLVESLIENYRQVAMRKTVELNQLIERREDLHAGRPVLAGTGVSVQRVAGWYKLGMTAEEIAENFGHLSLAQVHAALAYYHANRDEIEGYLESEESEARRLEKEASR